MWRNKISESISNCCNFIALITKQMIYRFRCQNVKPIKLMLYHICLYVFVMKSNLYNHKRGNKPKRMHEYFYITKGGMTMSKTICLF